MQRHRFFASPAQLRGAVITLALDEAHHLSRVLRLAPGNTAYCFDGQGAEYECEVQRVSRDEVTLRIVSRLGNEVESPLHLTLAQGMTKGDKFDWIVQKAVELGCSRFVPLITEHSEVRRTDGLDQKMLRWRRIALEATKQCGRRTIMEIAPAVAFGDLCESMRDEKKFALFFSERKGLRLGNAHVGREVTLVIGPEGGWSERESHLAEECGLIPVHLGSRVLRAETAAVTAVALAQYVFGDLG